MVRRQQVLVQHADGAAAADAGLRDQRLAARPACLERPAPRRGPRRGLRALERHAVLADRHRRVRRRGSTTRTPTRRIGRPSRRRCRSAWPRSAATSAGSAGSPSATTATSSAGPRSTTPATSRRTRRPTCSIGDIRAFYAGLAVTARALLGVGLISRDRSCSPVNTAPCGSRMTALRTGGMSYGSVRTDPPSSRDRAATASASSTENVTLQSGWRCGSTGGQDPGDAIRETGRCAEVGVTLADARVELLQEVGVAGQTDHDACRGAELDLVCLPAEDRSVEPDGALGIIGVHLAEVPRARCVHCFRASQGAGLPQTKGRTRRIGADGHPSRGGQVECLAIRPCLRRPEHERRSHPRWRRRCTYSTRDPVATPRNGEPIAATCFPLRVATR